MSDKRRTYGYIDQEKRETRTYGQEPTAKPKRRSTAWVRILTAPFVAIWTIIKFIGKGWKKLPTLSKSTKKLILKKLVWVGATVTVFGFLGLTILVAWASKDLPDPNKLSDRHVAQSTKIYDRTGEHLLYEIFSGEKRTLVTLDQIPQNLKNGLIATEDKSFYEHKGVRPLSMLRAFVYGVFTSKRIAGTSTLTQQLIKNAFLTNERNLTRKVKEIIMAIRLEQKYSKDEILQIYFNEIPYGSTNYGIESAAQSYLGKHVSELTLSESALLAGFPKSPSRYINDPEALKNRRDFVLERMYAENYITKEQKESAQAEPIAEIKHSVGNISAPHFVMYVKEQLVDTYGEQMVEQGGLKVITTLDWDKQEIAEKSIADNEKLLAEAGADNAALIALDPKTGQVLAHVGSRDFFNKEIDGQFDAATKGKLQPGSSFKPIIYAAAFEKGYTPDTILFDVFTNFAASGKPYTPRNYDLKERGPLTMRQALQGSLNIPAVETMYLVGEKKSVEFAERMGYTTLSQGDFGLTLVLGGGEVKPIEHAAAYSVFANNGVRHAPVSILKVEDPKGDVLYEWKPNDGERVIAPEIAATVSNVLSDDAARAYIFGAGGVLTLKDRPVAAKTGTTQGYKDAWTMGYTPSLVTGVWAGNSRGKEMKPGYGGNKVAGEIWNSFMRNSLANTPVENFPAPPENKSQKPILHGSAGGAIVLKVNKVNGKIATTSTPEDLIEERTYTQPHSILHYVFKDDPQGGVPEDPSQDPQYTIWENAIQDWIKRKKEAEPDWNIIFSDPPTEYDDTGNPELAPTITVNYPTPNSILTSRQINTDISVSAPRGVSLVTYNVDKRFIGSTNAHPFNISTTVRGLENGNHILYIIAEDDVKNTKIVQIPFTLEAGEDPPDAEWVLAHTTYNTIDFPRPFNLRLIKPDQIKEVRVVAEQIGMGKHQIASISDLSSLIDNQIIINWNEHPSTGNWLLQTEITKTNNEIIKGQSVQITIQ